MKKYSSIIVLAAGVTQNDNGPRRFEDGGLSFGYEIQGDPYEFRFKAAQKLFSTGACLKFILVGGDVETTKDGQKEKFLDQTGQAVWKSKVMAQCLVDHYKIPEENIVILHSESNTQGNAKEVARYFSENQINSLETVGLLTSFYHLPRSMRMFVDEANLRLVPISAESLIYDDEFENIRKFYQQEGFGKILSDKKDDRCEIKGAGDQEKGAYTPGFK